MRFINQKQILKILLISQIFLVCLSFPAQAQTSGNDVTSFIQQVLDYLKTAEKYVNDSLKELSTEWKSIYGQIEGEIDEIISSGNNDPFKIGKEVKIVISEQDGDGDIINTSPKVEGQNAEKEVHQAYTSAQAQAVLSEDGQDNQSKNRETSNNTVNDSSTQSDNAQNDVITQDILKKMAVQNVASAKLSQMLYGESQEQTKALATANMNLADISSQMTAEERGRLTEGKNARTAIIGNLAALDVAWRE